MEFPIDRVRLTHSEKNLLTRMKAKTGIDNWNIFSRWALCVSLSKSTKIDFSSNESNYAIEMSWMVFAGKDYKIYQDLLIADCVMNDLKPNKQNLNRVLRARISNGVKILHADTKSLDDLIGLAYAS